jgi:hypothetical protein
MIERILGPMTEAQAMTLAQGIAATEKLTLVKLVYSPVITLGRLDTMDASDPAYATTPKYTTVYCPWVAYFESTEEKRRSARLKDLLCCFCCCSPYA